MKKSTWSGLAFVCLFLALTSCQKQSLTLGDDGIYLSPTTNFRAPISSPYSPNRVADWMGFLSDQTPLSALAIPGTHDSGARHEPVAGTAKTQDLSIAEQLNAGVRFLDIRCRHYQDNFTIHHGAIYQHLNFDDVLNICQTFLAAHPNETIVMSVKPEHTAEGNTRTFEEQFNRYVQKNPGLWNLNDGIPTLGSSRGKIVLLRRFGANQAIGMNASSNWQDKATFTINNGQYFLRVQDQYQVSSNNQKWNAITSLWNESTSGNNQTFYINFTSGYQQVLWIIPNIPAVSDGINPQVDTFFSGGTNGRYGAVVMDFITAGTASKIVDANF